jgi:hypothetical protein
MTVLLLGWFFDFLFWDRQPGISFALFALLTTAAGLALLIIDGAPPSRGALFILPLLAFFLIMTFTRLEPMTAFLAHAFSLSLMILFTVTYRSGRWPLYSLADYISRFFSLLASMIAAPIVFGMDAKKLRHEAGEVEKRSSAVWPVLRGLLFALPVVVFFAALLSSADLVFAERVEKFVDIFKLENLPEYIFRAILISIVAYALGGVFLHALKSSQDDKLIGIEKPLIPPFLGFTEASIVLGAVALLFLSFVIIQFQYFFGGQANIRAAGFTYAEYAQRGFGELITVAFFSQALFLGLSAIARREDDRQRGIFSGLGLLIVALVGIMLVSAYQRLVLYELAYGFSRLRTYTHVFMIWLGLLLAATVVLDLLQRQRSFAFAGLLAALGFSATLMLMNVDGFIVRQNVERTRQAKELDVAYLASLSPDAVPVLADLYRSGGIDQSTRDQVGAALACYKFQAGEREENPDWQSFHLSSYWSARELDSLDLSAYSNDTERWPVEVTTPLGKTYDCYTYVISHKLSTLTICQEWTFLRNRVNLAE